MEVFLEYSSADPSVDTISSNNSECINFTISPTNAIKNVDVITQPIFYPNPSTDIIHWKTAGQTKLLSIRIYNMQGQLLFFKSLPMQTGTIDLSKFSNGIFQIKYETNTGVYHKKIIKQ